MMLFLIITYILSPRKRRFPTSFQLWVCVSSLISSIGIDIAVVVGGTTLLVLHVCRVCRVSPNLNCMSEELM
jgi:hypothetical protein